MTKNECMRIIEYPRQHQTGGPAARDAVYYLTWPARGHSDMIAATLAGGPLDAPDVMPAGCMQSTTWTDAHGHPCRMSRRPFDYHQGEERP